jgi:hypothetical protein
MHTTYQSRDVDEVILINTIRRLDWSHAIHWRNEFKGLTLGY